MYPAGMAAGGAAVASEEFKAAAEWTPHQWQSGYHRSFSTLFARWRTVARPSAARLRHRQLPEGHAER